MQQCFTNHLVPQRSAVVALLQLQYATLISKCSKEKLPPANPLEERDRTRAKWALVPGDRFKQACASAELPNSMAAVCGAFASRATATCNAGVPHICTTRSIV